MNEVDVPNARFWSASAIVADRAPTIIVLECERWYDARRIAQRLLGVERVDLAELDRRSMRRLPARTQVRWAGLAYRRVSDLRIEVREVDARGRAGEWRAP